LYYFVYKIINEINGKFYIGKHKTNNLNDGYFGSGKLLKRAIKKYGIENFFLEILFVCESEKEMILREKILVVPDNEINYNLTKGGNGSFDFININRLWNTEKYKNRLPKNHIHIMRNKHINELKSNSEYYLTFSNKVSVGNVNSYKNGRKKTFLGKHHTDDSKKIIGEKNSIHQSGAGNSQFGTMWISNGTENKKIKKETLDEWIKKGYYKGRI